ncbi:MAG TPA: hypothetical protein VJZ76_24935 [Thermoanaerobaculia bacterium]|nr:hypothetical protein [Thermoanaerobaculia bacterium]
MKRLLLAAALVALAVPAAFAKNDALSLVPNEAVSVGVVRLSDLRTSPLGSTLFRETDKISTDGDAEKFLRDAGLKPTQDIDVIVVATTPRTTLGSDAEVLVALDGRFDVARLTNALTSRGAVKKGGYYVLPEEHVQRDNQKGVVAFPDAHLALIGSETAVARALTARAAGGTTWLGASALGRDVARIDPKATAWAVVDVQRAKRIVGAPKMSSGSPQAAAINSALKSVSTVALWATDNGDSLKLGAFGLSSDTETLGLLEDTLRGALSAMRLAVQDKEPQLVGVLRKFTVARTNDSVTITGSVPAETFKNWSAKNMTK